MYGTPSYLPLVLTIGYCRASKARINAFLQTLRFFFFFFLLLGLGGILSWIAVVRVLGVGGGGGAPSTGVGGVCSAEAGVGGVGGGGSPAKEVGGGCGSVMLGGTRCGSATGGGAGGGAGGGSKMGAGGEPTGEEAAIASIRVRFFSNRPSPLNSFRHFLRNRFFI